jgi:hypothetical protein
VLQATANLSKKSDVTAAIGYAAVRWPVLTRYYEAANPAHYAKP